MKPDRSCAIKTGHFNVLTTEHSTKGFELTSRDDSSSLTGLALIQNYRVVN